MKIKPLERFSIDGQVYHEGEVRVVSDEVGNLACEHGWAEDVDGKVATGERSTTPKTVNVKKMTHAHGASDPTAPKEG